MRVEPPLSLPIEPATSRAATAAADPPDEPPAQRAGSSRVARRAPDGRAPGRAHAELVLLRDADDHGARVAQSREHAGRAGGSSSRDVPPCAPRHGVREHVLQRHRHAAQRPRRAPRRASRAPRRRRPRASRSARRRARRSARASRRAARPRRATRRRSPAPARAGRDPAGGSRRAEGSSAGLRDPDRADRRRRAPPSPGANAALTNRSRSRSPSPSGAPIADSAAAANASKCSPSIRLRYPDAMLDIRLLGGFAVQVDGTDVPEDAWRLRKARALVKLLALAPGHRMHREQVFELLWPGKEDARAAATTTSIRRSTPPAARSTRRAPTARRSWRCATTSSACTATSPSTRVELEAAIAAARADGREPAYEAALARRRRRAAARGPLRGLDHRPPRRAARAGHHGLPRARRAAGAARRCRRGAAARARARPAARARDAVPDARLRGRGTAGSARSRPSRTCAARCATPTAADPDEETRRLYRELLSAPESDEAPRGHAAARWR